MLRNLFETPAIFTQHLLERVGKVFGEQFLNVPAAASRRRSRMCSSAEFKRVTRPSRSTASSPTLIDSMIDSLNSFNSFNSAARSC